MYLQSSIDVSYGLLLGDGMRRIVSIGGPVEGKQLQKPVDKESEREIHFMKMYLSFSFITTPNPCTSPRLNSDPVKTIPPKPDRALSYILHSNTKLKN